MAVDQLDKVDFIAESKTGDCHLVISDHLDWEDEQEHMRFLQDKLNRYLAFVDNGELARSFPEMAKRRIVIDIRFCVAPTEAALQFLSRWHASLSAFGFGFQYKMLRSSVN